MPRELAPVAVLFARHDSVYFDLAAEVFDETRDARNYTGSLPVIAHPPCRAWCRMRHLAKPPPGERELAFFAIETVRRCGGVLEHPAYSLLWSSANLPGNGRRDQWGGWTLPLNQHSFGHRAAKPTWLYVIGVEPADVPRMPLVLGEATHTCGANSWHNYRYRARRPFLEAREREATPRAFAEWLCQLATRVSESRAAA